jgi:replicative DNA helicase
MPTSLSDAVHQTERALLGSILLDSSLWLQIDSLGAQDFGLEAHRRIYGRMAAMFEDQRPVDIVTLTLELAQLDELAACGDAAYLTSLLDHAFPENVPAYVRRVREAAQERRYSHLLETLSQSTQADDRLAKLEQMHSLLRGDSTALAVPFLR